eukprot:NODE_7467_length_438_cov_268.135770.p3 GENE.NODE_7467_length_438_cov_268.135770~~NODE_7467_length_438_cov_268.135770.p3  ORF type:complete len:63 (-),score=3.81 NODE_7467_length_438_cov_268.135770:137-325(-)
MRLLCDLAESMLCSEMWDESAHRHNMARAGAQLLLESLRENCAPEPWVHHRLNPRPVQGNGA